MTWRSGLGRGFRKLAHTVISLGMHIFLRPSTHILSRALLIDSGHILLMRQRYGGHYILPGGHVDAGESIEHAVERECLEECGIHLKAQKVLGVIEQHYKKCGFLKKQTLTFVWQMSPLGMHDTIHESEYLEKPQWVPLCDVQDLDLKPVVLKQLLPQWQASEFMAFHSTVSRTTL